MTILPPDPDLNALRLELGRLRAERGWSYDELASRSGLARRTVIEIEQGRTVGTLKTQHALAHALDTPFDELYHEHDLPGTDDRSDFCAALGRQPRERASAAVPAYRP